MSEIFSMVALAYSSLARSIVSRARQSWLTNLPICS